MKKIAVIGAGAIGNLAAGYLKLKGRDVCLVGRAETVSAIKNNGLTITGVRGNFKLPIDCFEKLDEKPDLAILAVKTQDIAKTLNENKDFLKNSLILTLQNGARADEIVSDYIPKENIVSSIVMFGATYLEPAKVIHNFEGNWIIGKAFDCSDEMVNKTAILLYDIFPAVIAADIRAMKYLKIFVNANNCIPAILGMSMQGAFSDLEISRLSIAIWKEGLEVTAKSGVTLGSLPNFPLERLLKLTSMPIDEAAKIFSGIMVNLSTEPLYGSILQSIQRNRPSEIDYINGEFVVLSEKNGFTAPLNKKLVEMVHQVEETGKFFNKEELLEETVNSSIVNSEKCV
ncbi:MAG: 2-dehydropantoate 2-reductase [Candidatus Omnitrophota bacterium]